MDKTESSICLFKQFWLSCTFLFTPFRYIMQMQYLFDIIEHVTNSKFYEQNIVMWLWYIESIDIVTSKD